MNTLYNRPRIKPIYPLYRLNKKEFRIGAQLGITAEFGDPEGQLWELASRLNGRPVKEVILEMRNLFPELSEEDILEGIKILENEAKKNNCWKDRIYCNRFVLAEPVSKRNFSVCFF